MGANRTKSNHRGEPSGITSTRITVSFSMETHQQIVQRAQQRKVSASWIVRDAVESYFAQELPLFARDGKLAL